MTNYATKSALAIALSKLNFIDANEAVLAGKSTLNRLEYCPETILDQANSRYHRIEHQPEELEQAFVHIFLDSYRKPPRQIILDMDVTDDQVHGNQEGAFFNKYYHGVCYAPLYIFCGHHLLVACVTFFQCRPRRRSSRRTAKNNWSNSRPMV